jgi:hypothetical protein
LFLRAVLVFLTGIKKRWDGRIDWEEKCRIVVTKRGLREKRKMGWWWWFQHYKFLLFGFCWPSPVSCFSRFDLFVQYSYCVLFPVSYWSGLCTLIYSWLEKNKSFISMACRALFVMLPVFFFLIIRTIINFQLCILVNESKYRPLYILLAESIFFFWTWFIMKFDVYINIFFKRKIK